MANTTALLVTPHYACKDTSGGGQRTQLLLASLLRLANITRVDVLVLDQQGRSAIEFFAADPRLGRVATVKIKERGQLGFWKLFRSFKPRLVDLLATTFGRRSIGYSSRMLAESLPFNLNDYDVVVGRYLRPSAIAGCFDSRTAIPVYLDVDDRDDMLYSSRLNNPDLPFYHRVILRWHLRQAESLQKKLLPQCRHCWLASQQDLNTLPTHNESVLPNIPYSIDFLPSCLPPVKPDNYNLLFVGSFGHRINREGIEWFLTHCWSELLDRVPNVCLRIVGSGGWENIDRRFKGLKNVDIVGFCESLEEEYAKCSMTIVPLFEGGGTKIKVLESLLYGRLVFGSAHAFWGYPELQAICSDAIASSAENFASDLAKVLIDEVKINRTVEMARNEVITRYSFSAFSQIVAEAFE